MKVDHLKSARDGIMSVLGTTNPSSPHYDSWHETNRGLSPSERKRLMIAFSLIGIRSGERLSKSKILAYLDKELVLWGDMP
jgi:hypothetical protein